MTRKVRRGVIIGGGERTYVQMSFLDYVPEFSLHVGYHIILFPDGETREELTHVRKQTHTTKEAIHPSALGEHLP